MHHAFRNASVFSVEDIRKDMNIAISIFVYNMPPKRSTRSTANVQVEKAESKVSEKTVKKSESPAFVLIHPKSEGSETIITLPHALTDKPTRYLLSPKGIYEIKAFQNPKTQPQSWLLVPQETGSKLGEGETVSSGTTYVTTQIDPLFLAIPVLFSEEAKKGRKRFISFDDLTEGLVEASPHWRRVLRSEGARKLLEARVAAVSDSVDGGDEPLYKPSEEKLIQLLLKRVERMAGYLASEKGGSLAQEFVSKPLAGPTALAPSSGNVLKSTVNEADEKPDSEKPEESKEEPKEEDKSTSEEAAVKPLQALLSAHAFLAQTLLPSSISSTLLTALKSAHDFTPLDAYLAKIKASRAELSAVRSSDFSMKRSYGEDDEERAEKRRKKEAEEEAEKKKKKSMSKAAKDLGKVNTKNMMKLSSFFTKK